MKETYFVTHTLLFASFLSHLRCTSSQYITICDLSMKYWLNPSLSVRQTFYKPVFFFNFILYSTLWYPRVRYVFSLFLCSMWGSVTTGLMKRSTGVPLPPAVIWNSLRFLLRKCPAAQAWTHSFLAKELITLHTFNFYQNDNKHRTYCVTQYNVQAFTHQHHNIHKEEHTQDTPPRGFARSLSHGRKTHKCAAMYSLWCPVEHFYMKLVLWFIHKPVHLTCGSSHGNVFCSLYVCLWSQLSPRCWMFRKPQRRSARAPQNDI